ncbi:hypothetical protein [Vibrio splendidus]|uniref:hypothetical protein n=1 Tax=Vibrio splendidus TaxID=29497 RepID=UPI00352C1560
MSIIKKCIQSALIVTLTLPIANYAMAYTPAIQAALFNGAVRDLDVVEQERLITYTKSLYKTLDTKEATSLLGHQQLKISSYMYLVNYWLTKSISGVLYERGITIDDQELEKLGIDLDAYKIPMNYIGSMNLSVNKASINGKVCTNSVNPTFKKTYLNVYNVLVKLMNNSNELDLGMPSRAALIYLKAHFYLKLHTPNATHTYVNNDCISDINGLMTCADEWVVNTDTTQDHVNRVREYMDYDLNRFNMPVTERNQLKQCKLTMYHYLQSGGITEPLTDGQTIAASEAMFNDISVKLKTYAAGTTWKSILRDNQEIMNFFYYPGEYKSSESFDQHTIGRTLLLNQMKASSVRLHRQLRNDLKAAVKSH